MVKISKKGGKISLHDSRITRPFFFETQTEREVDSVSDTTTMRLMQEQYVGFWVIHKYESGMRRHRFRKQTDTVAQVTGPRSALAWPPPPPVQNTLCSGGQTPVRRP